MPVTGKQQQCNASCSVTSGGAQPIELSCARHSQVPFSACHNASGPIWLEGASPSCFKCMKHPRCIPNSQKGGQVEVLTLSTQKHAGTTRAHFDWCSAGLHRAAAAFAILRQYWSTSIAWCCRTIGYKWCKLPYAMAPLKSMTSCMAVR